MRDLGPIDCFRRWCSPCAYPAAAFPAIRHVPKGGRAITTSCNRYRSDDGQRKPSAERGATGSKAPLDAMLVVPIIHLPIMGTGSPDNRRKADGSYQTQGVGKGIFCPSFAQKGGQWRASCLLDNRNSARGYDVDRWRSGPLLWIWPRTRLVGAFPRHRCRRGGVAYFSKRRRRVNEDRNKPVGWPSCRGTHTCCEYSRTHLVVTSVRIVLAHAVTCTLRWRLRTRRNRRDVRRQPDPNVRDAGTIVVTNAVWQAARIGARTPRKLDPATHEGTGKS